MTDSQRQSGTQEASGVVGGVRGHGDDSERSTGRLRVWTITVPAPLVTPVVMRKTGKVFQRQPFLNSNDRDSWRVTTPIKNGWIANAIAAATETGLPKALARIRIDGHIIKPRGGDYDAMNYYPTAKALVDGLTRYGLTSDDSNKYVSGPFLHEGGKGSAAIIITITEEQS
jgi:hypothetical protein